MCSLCVPDSSQDTWTVGGLQLCPHGRKKNSSGSVRFTITYMVKLCLFAWHWWEGFSFWMRSQWTTAVTHLLPYVCPGWWTLGCPRVVSCWLHGTLPVDPLDSTWKHGSILQGRPKQNKQTSTQTQKRMVRIKHISVVDTDRVQSEHFSPVKSVLVWCRCFPH